MAPRLIRLLGCVLAAMLGASGPAAGAAAPPPTEELKALRGKLEALKKEIARSETSQNETTESLKAAETAISDANRRLTELGASKDEVDAQLAQLRTEHGQVEQGLARQRRLAARLVHQHYTAAPAGALQALAAGENPNDLARTTTYLGYVARARREILDTLRRDSETLRALERESARRQAELEDIQRVRLAELRRLETERENRKQALAKIAASISRQRQEAGALAKDEARLTRVVEELARMLAARKAKAAQQRKPPPPASTDPRPASPPPPVLSGNSVFEQLKGRLQMPVRGELVGRFGSPRSDSGLSWRGLFIQAPAGREVKAVAPGRVVFADWLRGFGNLLILDHGDGFMSLYGNNETLIGRIGDPVRGGDTVAIVGASGGNTVSGLYFEMRHQGRPFDPSGWLNLK
jgi:septal ring factor EnvC (AmiA/AmiB activator)